MLGFDDCILTRASPSEERSSQVPGILVQRRKGHCILMDITTNRNGQQRSSDTQGRNPWIPTLTMAEQNSLLGGGCFAASTNVSAASRPHRVRHREGSVERSQFKSWVGAWVCHTQNRGVVRASAPCCCLFCSDSHVDWPQNVVRADVRHLLRHLAPCHGRQVPVIVDDVVGLAWSTYALCL